MDLRVSDAGAPVSNPCSTICMLQLVVSELRVSVWNLETPPPDPIMCCIVTNIISCGLP